MRTHEASEILRKMARNDMYGPTMRDAFALGATALNDAGLTLPRQVIADMETLAECGLRILPADEPANVVQMAGKSRANDDGDAARVEVNELAARIWYAFGMTDKDAQSKLAGMIAEYIRPEIAPRRFQFVAAERNVMHGTENVAVARSCTFAKRIARALNFHRPNRKGQ